MNYHPLTNTQIIICDTKTPKRKTLVMHESNIK